MILIVEDQKDLNDMVALALKEAGYETQAAYDGLYAMKQLKRNEYELLLLDIMLPYKSGDQVLKELRTFSDIPVIVMSAKDMVGTKVDLLKLGADDYVTKPFDLDEVVARVESNLRRTRITAQKSNLYHHKNLTIDANSKRAFIKELELNLTAKEYEILEAMVKNPTKVYTKANLYQMIWGEEYYGDDNTIKTHLSNLRAKLKKADSENEYIETVWGLGYRLTKQG